MIFADFPIVPLSIVGGFGLFVLISLFMSYFEGKRENARAHEIKMEQLKQGKVVDDS